MIKNSIKDLLLLEKAVMQALKNKGVLKQNYIIAILSDFIGIQGDQHARRK